MNGVLAFKLAELFDFKTTGSVFLFLGRSVVPAFALSAFQNNDFAHDLTRSFRVSSVKLKSGRGGKPASP